MKIMIQNSFLSYLFLKSFLIYPKNTTSIIKFAEQ
jgi:hypothetical protein